MKINPTLKTNYDSSYQKNNLSPQQTLLKGLNTRDQVSFSGLNIVSKAKGGVANFMNWIEKGNFFIEFLVVDAISMIIPRALVGLNRDKKETGKTNYKAGMEELGRELSSGPSMATIPMGILYAFTKFNPAAHIPKDTLLKLTSAMEEVIKETTDKNILADANKLNTKLAEKLFDKAFDGFEFDNKANLKKAFATRLGNPETKPQVFEQLVSVIHNKNKAKMPLDTKTIKIKGEKTLETSAKELLADFKLYSKDMVNKLAKQDFTKKSAENCIQEATKYLKDTHSLRRNTRIASTVTAFFAVGAFLLYLPKLYLRSKTSPAEESAKRARMKGGANEN